MGHGAGNHFLKMKLLFPLLLLLLGSDVLPHLLLVPTRRTHTAAPSPRVESCEVVLTPQVVAVDPDRRLPILERNRVRLATTRWDAQAQVHLVDQIMASHEFDSVPAARRDFSDPTPQSAEDRSLPVLRHEDDVIPTMPSHVGPALVYSLSVSFLLNVVVRGKETS